MEQKQTRQIEQNILRELEELRRMESVVEAFAGLRAPSHTALYAQAAAHRAAYCHTGSFFSKRIEAALGLAGSTLGYQGKARGAVQEITRILHVVTELPWPEGGHTRRIERWIRFDSGRTHSLVLTSPRDGVPPALRDAVASTGGAILSLAPESASFARRALQLREIAESFDTLVIHAHAYDAVPTMALAWPGRPPTIVSNHDGHIFWIGRSIADAVACGRDVAIEICTARRSIPGAACSLLPLAGFVAPLDPSLRESTRRELDVEADDILLLTIASGYKFHVDDPAGIAELLLAVVRDRPQIVWRVVGPSAEGRWKEIESRSRGRIRCLGQRWDAAALYRAADAYLDTYPFTSQTSLVDAACASLPLIARRHDVASAAILTAWGTGLDPAILPFADATDLLTILDSLCDATRRVDAGSRAFSAVEAFSLRKTWMPRLERLYQMASRRVTLRKSDGTAPEGLPPETGIGDIDIQLAKLHLVDAPPRVFINWQREITNVGASEAFPAEESWVAETTGLGGVAGQLELIIRDYEARVSELESHQRRPSVSSGD